MTLAINDPSKLRIDSGLIYYHLYQQDEAMQDMTARDTPHNRLFVAWVQMHDRYTVGGIEQLEPL